MILEPNLLIDELSVLRILDQTLLPNEEVFLDLRTTEEIWEAIRKLRVRGAPAIGIAAGFGAYLAAKNIDADPLPFADTTKVALDVYSAS